MPGRDNKIKTKNPDENKKADINLNIKSDLTTP